MKFSEATPEAISEAAEIIREGGIVVVPTETVYGLAADAMNPKAVAKIFAAKGRPPDNPLIVHIAELEGLIGLVSGWPSPAPEDTRHKIQDIRILAQHFWPGPLSVVLYKGRDVPKITTGGLNTVAVRMPKHAVMRDLIRLSAMPLAAPSANLFTQLSPTRVDHLNSELLSKVDMVLDGGSCEFGIESTVLDLTSEPPALLRPGAIGKVEIENALGVYVACDLSGSERKSPGTHPRHYAPRTPMEIVDDIGDRPGLTMGKATTTQQIEMPVDASAYAAALYGVLHSIDALGFTTIYVQAPPRIHAWEAVWDRLRRASFKQRDTSKDCG